MEWIDKDYLTGFFGDFKSKTTKNTPHAIFDFDGTLIKTKSGKTFYEDVNDWILFSENVVKVLKKLSTKYTIIIITNQMGIEKGKTNADEWKKKAENFCVIVNIPICILCSKGDDIYRKPHPTLFNILNKGLDIVNINKSFYCGDAMGRKGDHADTDLKFALNCNLFAITPEKLFLGKDDLTKNIKYPNIFKINTEFDIVPKQKEMIIMVGYPGSGKSHLTKLISDKSVYNHISISRDMLGTIDKCIKRATDLCSVGSSIIIDNTNPSVDDRKKFINIAKKFNYKCRCIHVLTDMETSKHNNYNRRYITGKNLIPKIVYNIFKKNFVAPSKAEGFDEIFNVIPPTPLNLDYTLYYF
jgi:bifunctional polynucleotide phosphatase/kinase